MLILKFTYIIRVASRQRGKFEILVVSGGQGDVNSHTMYIVKAVSRQLGKFEKKRKNLIQF